MSAPPQEGQDLMAGAANGTARRSPWPANA